MRPRRLASGFADDDAVRTSGKTGTLPAIRNEVGVVQHPDGRRYAIAVFTRSGSPARKNLAADIGRAPEWPSICSAPMRPEVALTG